VVVVETTGGGGVVVVVCSDVVVRLEGAGPQPDRSATPPISAATVAMRTRELFLIITWVLEVWERGFIVA
jgi:hypothetical protein